MCQDEITMSPLFTALEDALQPRRFHVGPGYRCRIERDVAETCRWEIFRGNLLDPAFTREEKSFRSWQVFIEPLEQPAAVPMLSLKWDEAANLLHVTRSLEIQGWEAYAQGNLVDSRPARKWQPELIGTLSVGWAPPTETHLAVLVRYYLHLAIVGTSRLPITSVESPLPLFSLGLLSYSPQMDFLPETASEPTSPAFFLETQSSYRVKHLETFLRTVSPERLTELCVQDLDKADPWWRAAVLRPLLQALFHQVALSPFTHFIDNWVLLLRFLSRPYVWGPASVADLIGEYLRLLVRHLTAFDLHKFHNLGANYPDALFLDLLLRLYLELLDKAPALTNGDDAGSRLRRRALRQGWLARRMYEGHPVPDAPTSPGENLRRLPAPFHPVAEEQLSQPQKRTRRLFVEAPSDGLLSSSLREVLRHSLDDLEQESERRELGLALFLDRPLGVFKLTQGQMRDRTPLLSYLAFSRKIAQQRLKLWHTWGWLDTIRLEHLSKLLANDHPAGIPVVELPLPGSRPGVICLEDTLQVSNDFLLLRTTRSSLAELWRQYDTTPLRQLGLDPMVTLLMRSPRSRGRETPPAFLTGFDAEMRPRWELVPTEEPRYQEWAGVEYLVGGLRLLRAWDEERKPLQLPTEPFNLEPLYPPPE
jgi:hypothetical protein